MTLYSSSTTGVYRHSDPKTSVSDKQRDRRLKLLGYEVLRYAGSEMGDQNHGRRDVSRLVSALTLAVQRHHCAAPESPRTFR